MNEKLKKEVEQLFNQGYNYIITYNDYCKLCEDCSEDEYLSLTSELDDYNDPFYYYDGEDLFNIDEDLLEFIKKSNTSC